jgi:hypothetical protein
MNAYTGKLMRCLAALSAVGLLSMGQPAFSQGNCKQAKGTWTDVWSGGNFTRGTITNAGFLNGTTAIDESSSAYPTPVPTTVSYTAKVVLTTHQGQLRYTNLYLYDFATGLWTAMGRIDPSTSTGRFAGATGVLYFNGKTVGTAIPFSYPSDIAGEVCLAGE